MFEKRSQKQIRPPRQGMEIKGNLKYLGVVFDNRKRAQRLANRLSYLAKVTYGSSREFRK